MVEGAGSRTVDGVPSTEDGAPVGTGGELSR